jgi:hypothetical protein
MIKAISKDAKSLAKQDGWVDYRITKDGVPVKESVNENTYKLGDIEYTKKNMTPTQILDLAMAYSQVKGKGTTMWGNKMEKMINVGNDLAKLNGTTQQDAKKRGKPALILTLLKNKLVTKDEYIKLYKDLLLKQTSVVKALKNADPASRMVGGAAARAAHRDMKGHYDESVNEAMKPSQVRSAISKVKKGLMRKWKQKGGYENFGQKELSQMRDKFDYNPYGSSDERQIAKMLDGFDNWAMNYDGDMREAYIVSYAKKKGEKPVSAAFQLRGSALSFERDLKKDGYITMITQKKVKGIDEARRSVVHKAAKKGSFPVSLVVVKNGKVIDQELVKTPEAVPAAFNVIQSKHKGAIIHIEDKTGKRLFSESLEESLGAEIDLIMQNSNNLRDFLKKIFADSDFRDMRNDKDFIKYLKSIYEGINEMDLNDPMLVRLRAAQIKRNQQAADRLKKAKSDKEKEKAEKLAARNATKIKALKKKRAEVMRDMEQEAEPEGGKIADRYGRILNKIDNDIIKLGGNPMTNEEKINLFVEENVPTNPSKWAYYKAQAKKKFDVYPSAYANGWAAKKYKAAGGGWRKEK